MILDSSALVAILLREPGFEAFDTAIAEAETTRISAATFVELSIILASRAGQRAVDRLDEILSGLNVIVEPVTELQARIARTAFSRYGKGNHAAGLNFGDCFAYALSKDFDEPLLFKGEDFRKTDLTPAIA